MYTYPRNFWFHETNDLVSSFIEGSLEVKFPTIWTDATGRKARKKLRRGDSQKGEGER